MNEQPRILQQLNALAIEVCEHPPRTAGRIRAMNELIRAIEASGKLWYEPIDGYDDAKQKAWFYLVQNLCEAVTAKRPYDPEISSVTTWLNGYLRRRIQDLQIEHYNSQKTRLNFVSAHADLDPLAALPAQPDIPPILETVTDWVMEDREGVLRSLHLPDRPDINAQQLILRRLPPEKSWQEIGDEFNYSWKRLTNFYHHHCRKHLRRFGASQGWLAESS